VNFQEPPS